MSYLILTIFASQSWEGGGRPVKGGGGGLQGSLQYIWFSFLEEGGGRLRKGVGGGGYLDV